ncbi:hypothetical protein BHE74_00007310 [Ensete ventricosum]|nr:hypothetical protein BHE74_00007310 [Ensete ventricosum]
MQCNISTNHIIAWSRSYWETLSGGPTPPPPELHDLFVEFAKRRPKLTGRLSGVAEKLVGKSEQRAAAFGR